MRGLTVNDETLAAEVIARVGPGNDYIMDEHTLTHFREEFYFSPLANRMNAPTWEAAGGLDAVERAHQRVQEVLARPAESLLSENQSREVQRLAACAEEALANLEVRI